MNLSFQDADTLDGSLVFVKSVCGNVSRNRTKTSQPQAEAEAEAEAEVEVEVEVEEAMKQISIKSSGGEVTESSEDSDSESSTSKSNKDESESDEDDDDDDDDDDGDGDDADDGDDDDDVPMDTSSSDVEESDNFALDFISQCWDCLLELLQNDSKEATDGPESGQMSQSMINQQQEIEQTLGHLVNACNTKQLTLWVNQLVHSVVSNLK